MESPYRSEAYLKSISGGRDGKEYSSLYAPHYQRNFTRLHDLLGISPQKIFVGACGYGADLLAAHRTWPDALITAVSVGDVPTAEVRNECGSMLDFQERTILDYFFEANYYDTSMRGFNLIVISNTVTPEIRDPNVIFYLQKIIAPSGYIFNQVAAGIPLDIWTMDLMFDRTTLPEGMDDDEYLLWRSHL